MVRVHSVGIDGPLESYARGFAASLLSRGFTLLSARNQLRLFSNLSGWLSARRLLPGALTESRADAFLAARRRAHYTCWRTRRGLEEIFVFLRDEGVVEAAVRIDPQGSLDRLLAAYGSHLREEQLLSPTTVRSRVDVAREFLVEFGATRRDLRRVGPGDVQRYLRSGARRRYSPRSLSGIGSQLRSLYRYLFVAGFLSRDLREAVPAAPGLRHRTIPSGITASDARKLIDSCDQRAAIGCRDRAVILLLVRLGLRAGEVLRLSLEDIDWRAGEVVVHGKGTRRDLLPLPADVGEALSKYLRRRPQVAERRVFLRDRAPHRALHAVGFIVFAASLRAGIGPVCPHRLRRTAATEMLRQGATLAQISEVLRHSVTQTTAIYARVDRHGLRPLARPWPGAIS